MEELTRDARESAGGEVLEALYGYVSERCVGQHVELLGTVKSVNMTSSHVNNTHVRPWQGNTWMNPLARLANTATGVLETHSAETP